MHVFRFNATLTYFPSAGGRACRIARAAPGGFRRQQKRGPFRINQRAKGRKPPAARTAPERVPMRAIYNYLDGRHVQADSRSTFSKANPATGEPVASVPDSDERDVAAAVEAA